MARCLLALGSNLGDRRATLSRACAEVSNLPGCQLLARSDWHATAPIGGAAGQGEFLNGAVLVETTWEPRQLAVALQEAEAHLGRERTARWDARTIDIDILLCDEEIIETDDLIVPHPRMAFRNFVLEPAAEIAGAMLHPTSGWTIARLLEHLRHSPRYIIVTAPDDEQRNWLSSQLSQLFGATVSQQTSGLEFPQNIPGTSPVIVSLPPAGLTEAQFIAKDFVRPALVIALAGAAPEPSRCVEHCSRGWGPLAKITADNPDTIMQEATAALRCMWPDL